MNRRRYRVHAIQGMAFRRLDPLEWGGKPACYYCGALATSEDHTIPVAMLNNIGLMPSLERPEIDIVPACQSCNSMLGDRYFPSMRDRTEFVKIRLVQRHAELIRAPFWSDDELDSLRGGMKANVQRKQWQRDEIVERILYGLTLQQLWSLAEWLSPSNRELVRTSLYLEAKRREQAT